MGRPSIRTPEMVDEIIARVSDGEPLAQVCRDDGMPHRDTFYDWAASDEELSRRFARARELGFDMIAIEALRIADTTVEGVTTKITDKGIEETREDMLGHRKLQVETRLKLLAKWDPKRYGDRQAIDHGGQEGNPVRTESTVLEIVPGDYDPEERDMVLRIAHKRLQGAS